MESEIQRNLAEAFAEVPEIGREYASKSVAWIEANIDENDFKESIVPEISGDTLMMLCSENGVEEKDILRMIEAIGFTIPEESDDEIISETLDKNRREVDEWLNNFLGECIEIVRKYDSFEARIDFQEGSPQRKAQVRIILASSVDIRLLSSYDMRKMKFLALLRDLRVIEKQYGMTDEAFVFSQSKGEFWIVLHPQNSH